MSDVHFRLLGTTEIVVDGRPAPLPGAAERALLVLLLLSPERIVPATTLIDRLWSESALPVDPMNALQVRVSKLRRALRPIDAELVTREGIGYRANVEPSAIDAERFVALVRRARAEASRAAAALTDEHLSAYDEGLSLWSGEPLADFSTEQWAMAEAGRLTELRLAALGERAQVALALGRHPEVVTDLQPVVTSDPTLEALAGQLMIALYRSARQADALEVYSRTRRVLDETLGLEPSQSLRSLQERVLRQDEGLDRPVSSAAPAVRVGAQPHGQDDRGDMPGALPTVVRRLIGRDAQLDALCQQVTASRLVSLVGPGGAGKTSLAMAAAARTGPDFAGGAVGVRLASVDHEDQVPLAVADALGVPLDSAASDRDVRARVTRYLATRRLLLLLDNCEHVIDAVASLVDDVLARCPGVTVLATSREALGLPEELQVLVGPLETPTEDARAATVLAYAAPQLFVERARHVRPGLQLDEDDLRAVANISRSLDGLPLAMELAAARVASMSPLEIADRLANRFALLTGGARTAEARQQTLRATVDWSYALLEPLEQTVFNRLSIFQGGWTLTAAEAVIADEGMAFGAVLDTIGRLISRSLVVAEPGRTTRYRMLATLREYASERLVESGEHNWVAQSHADYYRTFTEAAEPALRGYGQRDMLRRLRAERPNIRSAIAWLSGPGGDLDAALTMAGSLALFWHLGRHLEGRDVLARLLDVDTGSPAARARALQAVSIVERPRGCLVHPSPRCARTAQESLEMFEQLGDPRRAALSRVLLAVEGVTGADTARADTLLAEAQDQFDRDEDLWGKAVIGFVRTEMGLKRGDEAGAIPTGRATATAFRQLEDPWGLSAILYHLGWGLRQFGRYDEGARALEEAIDVASGAGLHNTAQWALADLGITHIHLGNVAAARDAFDRTAAASDHIGDGAGAVLSHYGHGLLAQVMQRWSEARPRYAAALEGFDGLGTPVMWGLALAGLARCDEAQADIERARQRYSEARDVGRVTGEGSLTALTLEGLARLAALGEDDAEAQRLVSEAARLREKTGRPAPPHERADLAALVQDPRDPLR